LLINEIQQALHESPLENILYSIYQQAFKDYNSGLGTYSTVVPRSTREYTDMVAVINASKAFRNMGVGEYIWHRLMNPYYTCNWDAHNAQMFKALREADVIPTDGLPIVMISDHEDELRRYGVAKQFIRLTMAEGIYVKPEADYSCFYFAGFTKSTKPIGLADAKNDVLYVLAAVRNLLKPGDRVVIRCNAARMPPPSSEVETIFKGYKYLKCAKAGGLHTPECFLTFAWAGVPEAPAYKPLYVSLQFLLAMASSATNYMTHMVHYGILDAAPDTTRLAYQVAAGTTIIPLREGTNKNHSWYTDPIPLPAPARIISDMDSLKPELEAHDADDYM